VAVSDRMILQDELTGEGRVGVERYRSGSIEVLV
jgi:hypothetical protein